jgi:hypothetical protein
VGFVCASVTEKDDSVMRGFGRGTSRRLGAIRRLLADELT